MAGSNIQRWYQPWVFPRVVETQTVRVANVFLGTQAVATNFERVVFVSPSGKDRIKRAVITIEGTVTADVSNFWDISLIDKTDGKTLNSAVLTTSNAAINAYDAKSVGVDQNNNPATYSVITLKGTATRSPGALTGLFVQIDYGPVV